MRVLLVARGEADARRLSGRLLRPSAIPLEVVTATDLGAALRHLAEHAVDLIVLNLALCPEGDRAALKLLKAQAPAAPLLVVADRHGGPEPLIPRLALVARMASVGCLATGVAHEVNNLLCALSSQLQVLQLHEELHPDLTPALEAMEGWVRRAAERVEALLEYALRPSGTRSQVDLPAVTSRMLRLLQGSARFRHLDLFTDFAPTLPPLELDEAAWEQVVFELAANAAEAISSRGCLRVRARQRPGNCPPSPLGGIEVTFEDDGPGIPAEHVSRLFEPFFTTKAEGEHPGLGLTIVRSILRDHQGEIRVEANQPSGTRVVIRLPAPGLQLGATR
jgi:signal transduction histidine kinase